MSLLLSVGAGRVALDSLAEAAAPPLAGSPSGSQQVPSVTALSLIILYALLLVFGYCAPLINDYINRSKQSARPKHLSWPFGVRSFAGGMAASYVFILLIPEMELFNSEIRIPFFNAYSLALLGLLIFKGLQHYCRHLAQERTRSMEEWAFVHSKSHEKHLSFRISGYVFIAYSSLILLTLPFQVSHLATGMGVFLYLVTFSLHLCFELLSLNEEDVKHYSHYVPVPLAICLTAALGLALSNALPQAYLLACISLLAGIIIYNVFLVELPNPDRSSYVWFLTGAVAFVLMNTLTLRAVPH
jgi:hypothetical protein